MEIQSKCQLAVCACRTSAGQLYCSEYCQQAAAQAIPRDFCQCPHAGCEHLKAQPVTESAQSLPALISGAPGQVTIQYASAADLQQQLQGLLQVLAQQSEVLLAQSEDVPRRRSVSEGIRPRQQAQSA